MSRFIPHGHIMSYPKAGFEICPEQAQEWAGWGQFWVASTKGAKVEGKEQSEGESQVCQVKANFMKWGFAILKWVALDGFHSPFKRVVALESTLNMLTWA